MELLPCPFCGSEAKSFKTDIGPGYQTSSVKCCWCAAVIAISGLNAESIWNTRYTHTPDPVHKALTMYPDKEFICQQCGCVHEMPNKTDTICSFCGQDHELRNLHVKGKVSICRECVRTFSLKE